MAEPVDLQLAKQHCKAETDEQDALVQTYLVTARILAEAYSGLTLVANDAMVEVFDAFTPSLQLRSWPVREIVEIAYVDANGDTQLVDDGGWRLAQGNRPARLSAAVGSRWPTTEDCSEAVSVTFKAGYATPEDVPESAKSAILLATRHLFDHRSQVIVDTAVAIAELPMSFRDLLSATPGARLQQA